MWPKQGTSRRACVASGSGVLSCSGVQYGRSCPRLPYTCNVGKVRVPRGRTFMQNCVKIAGSSLTWCRQPQAVVWSTVRACPRHACSQWTLSSGHVSCSGNGWACGLPGNGTQTSTAPEFIPATYDVDFCIENVALLSLAQQEALDAPSDQLVAYVLLDGKAVLVVGGGCSIGEREGTFCQA